MRTLGIAFLPCGTVLAVLGFAVLPGGLLLGCGRSRCGRLRLAHRAGRGPRHRRPQRAARSRGRYTPLTQAHRWGSSRADLPDSSRAGRRGHGAGCHRGQRSGRPRTGTRRRRDVGRARTPPPQPACPRPRAANVGPGRRTPAFSRRGGTGGVPRTVLPAPVPGLAQQLPTTAPRHHVPGHRGSSTCPSTLARRAGTPRPHRVPALAEHRGPGRQRSQPLHQPPHVSTASTGPFRDTVPAHARNGPHRSKGF